jgi:hypothetical protein
MEKGPIGEGLMKLRQIVFGLLVIAFCFLAMGTRFVKSTVDEASAQVASASASPTPAFTVSASLIPFRDIPGGGGNGTTIGAMLLVTSSATEQTTINFYYQCVPNESLGKLGTCPTGGFMVYSAPVCTNPMLNQNSGDITCTTP